MPDCVRRLDIPPEPIPAGRAFLEIAGINDYSIFPTLNGSRMTSTAATASAWKTRIPNLNRGL